MKKIVCELCGESDFLKVNGMFECQVCGAKYSLADARKLFVDVDDDSAAQKNNSNQTLTKAPQTDTDETFSEDPVLAPKPIPTTVRRVVVQTKTPSNDPTAVRRIVSSVQKQNGTEVKRPVVKRVVVKPQAQTVVKPQTVVRKPEAKPVVQPADVTRLVGNDAQMIQNLFILAQTAYDSENYIDAETYANRIIEIDSTNSDAWLLKGNCAGWQTNTPNFRLLESINCWNTCLLNCKDAGSKTEYEDYEFTVRTNCIEIAVAYVLRNIQDFKKNPGEESIAKIKETIDYVDPMMRKANQTFGVDVIAYEDKLASNISALVNEVSKAATSAYGKRKETQTDEAYTKFVIVQDACIEVWDYLMDLAKKHGTVTAILHSIVKMHETIIRSCGYKQSGNKYKESKVCSLAEKNQRLEKIGKAKKKLQDKFVDIRKRDRVDQKIKNEKYWEEHQEEKEQLLNERTQLDHEVFELENSKLKMPKLTELKKLEEEAIRLQVLQQNPTYSGKERAAFSEELQKTRKLITTKKREIANIINPIDDKIESLKKRMFNIDTELNQNR